MENRYIRDVLKDHAYPKKFVDREVPITGALPGTCAVKSNCKMMQKFNGHNHTKPKL
jgi:hypothetical protein